MTKGKVKQVNNDLSVSQRIQWLKEKWNKSNNDLSRKSKNTMTKGKVKQVKQWSKP